MLLTRIRYHAPAATTAYPFNLPWLQGWPGLTFTTPITILVGENGSGKSTLLEAIATNYEAILMSGAALADNEEYDLARELGAHFKLEWTHKTRGGFFFRADDFISYLRATRERQAFATRELARIDAIDPTSLERQPYLNTLAEIRHMYAADLDHLSHGQAFLGMFERRLRPGELYLLDEPEAPLTPQNQLALLALIHDAAATGAQFILSTHSPILMALPGATLYELGDTLAPTHFDDIAHVQFMRNFLADPGRFIHHLFPDS
ncbi:AAA family ATPase [Lacticaseibacillus nasuensis]|uniref:AAA family ATPase n=1 Tax=Lacticaseibacillus nasuensis TaxID=944671 RepID=UPI002245C15E|nr:AAA family ATPase [Lacticaseibacillus nasuensis]MCX2455826.1 AAA family ATPase [Lacticaseibacillus nasuensis]